MPNVTAPMVRISGSEVNKFNVTGVNRYDYQGFHDLGVLGGRVTYTQHSDGGEDVDINLSDTILYGGDNNYVYIEMQHDKELPSDTWTFVSLFHPKSTTRNQTTRDLFNRYAFTPGHFVEIRYTSVQFFTVLKPGPTSTTWEKFKSFIGYMDAVEDFSYQSTVQHIPFPADLYGPNSTVIIIRPPSILEFTEYEEEKTSFKDTMAKIGGLLSLVGSVVVFLFGVSLVSPWGFLASLPFFRRRMSNSLAKAYNSAEGLSKGPFTTRIDEIGDFDHTVPTDDMKITMLKERIDELELVLSEYYLDGCVFQHYSEERDKVRLERAKTRSGRAKGKQDDELPGRTLYDNQSQHKGRFPSPEFPPLDPKTGLEQQQRQQQPYHYQEPSSEPGALAYYQQQEINKTQGDYKRGGPLSQQSLLGHGADDDHDHGFGAPPLSENDAQKQGLLQLDHHQLQQSHIQQQAIVQSPSSGLTYSPKRGFAAAPMTGQDAFPFHSQSSTAGTQLSPSPAGGAASTVATTAGRGEEADLWWKANPAPATAPAYRSRPGSVATVNPALSGASSTNARSNAPESTYEHLDLTDLSKLRKED
ncbi:hypothetical protein EC968_000955 [Mortierella alpina]|nr:hypothetical protein EC968_000955 [Mortierella alpina]